MILIIFTSRSDVKFDRIDPPPSESLGLESLDFDWVYLLVFKSSDTGDGIWVCVMEMFVISIHWSQVLRREWRCGWSSADRLRSNYIWVINKFIAY